MARPTKSNNVSPSLPDSQWSALYQTADALFVLKPWVSIPPDLLLCTPHPVSGDLFYASVMGQMGEVFGLSIQYGPWAEYILMKTFVEDDDDCIRENLHRMNSLKLEFVKKNELSKDSKERIRRLCYRPSYTLRGCCWPNFEVMKNGSIPLPPDANDAALLMDLLPRFTTMIAAIDSHLGQNPEDLPEGVAMWPEGRSPESPLNFSEIRWKKFKVPNQPATDLFSIDEFTRERLLQFPQTCGPIELDSFVGMSAVHEGSRPFFIKLGLVVDSGSGMILGFESAQSGQDSLENIAGRLLIKTIDTIKSRPNEVRIRQEILLQALRPAADSLGINIQLTRILPALDSARRSIPRDFGV